MGAELVSGRSSLNGGDSKELAPVSITSIFEAHLPYYLLIGMTPEQFWECDCTLVIPYRKAWELRQRKENYDKWLQGLYFYEALCDISPVLHAFAKRGTKPREYMPEPIALTQKEIDERRERDERKNYEDMRARFSAWAAQTNIQFAQKAVKEEVRENE